MNIFITIVAFFATIGLLVAVHEFGHYWVARKLGVKVLRFSIGFGKVIWKKKGKDEDEVEYALSLIPLGGYVKMLDEREGDVDPAERHRAFNLQPVWKRFLIVLAGPVFNFIFAIFAFAVTYMAGIDSVRPYLATPAANSPAAISGVVAGDRVLSINNQPIETVNQLRLTVLGEYLGDSSVSLQVEQANGSRAERVLDLSQVALLKDEGDYFKKIGLNLERPENYPVVTKVLPDSAAASAGLQADDHIQFLNGEAIKSTREFSEFISSHPDQVVNLGILRDGKAMDVSLTPKLTEFEGRKVGMIGIGMAYLKTAESVNKLEFKRKASLLESIKLGAIETWDMSLMTLRVMGRLVTGQASIKNISGPLTIADYAGKSAVIGFSVFMSFLAIISLSLGVLNLLPVPMLDGGHLMYYIIEIVKGSPVSEKFEAMGMRVGMAMVGVLMVLAIYNDITRLVS
ncbi:RIP metalloprotease RseP [Leucothrix pacifica]|uniref:Zinc metalloprotease n=1 Tax=Leucothrix pacifica TaxID=1247513 RepID=A0A317C3D7_9GAMM|nr:RIP metalloprotease RseP [Leucothrix pacifica]PWQ92681.1 RIP metalloprotease RseP [Leucothrix pacifica]